MSKRLVAYFSASGVTEGAAKNLAEAVGGDIFEIEAKVPYTPNDLNWKDSNSRSSREMNNKSSRPEIKSKLENMDEYEIVFLGFPIWWYVAPTIINTFIESYDFSGKTVITFCTSGGSSLGNSDNILKACCAPSVHWIPGKRLTGRESKESLMRWVNGLGI